MTPRAPSRTHLLAFLIVVSAASRALAATPPPTDGAADAGPVTTPPAITTRAEPAYPPEALADRLEATVDVEVVLSEDGSVARSRVVTPRGHGFDEAALDAVKRSVFEPGRSNGVPIASIVDLSYEFHPPLLQARGSPPPGRSRLQPLPRPRRGRPGCKRGRIRRSRSSEKGSTACSILEPESAAASDSATGQAELGLRPRLRTENVL